MLKALEEFKTESYELAKLKEERSNLQAVSNKLIKNEVIDMADRMEIMQKMI